MPLKQLFDVLARQAWVFVVVFLAALVAGVGYTLSLPKLYQTKATLFVGENRPISTGANAVQLDEVLGRTYSELLDTADVRREVVAALPFRVSARQVDKSVSFEVVTGTRLIEITAEDPSAGRAAQLANTYANTFVRYQRRSVAEGSKQRLSELDGRIRSLVLDIQRLQGRPGGDAAAQLERAQTELGATRRSYDATEQNLALQDSNVSVSTRASVPSNPAKPRVKLLLAVSLVVAAALALAAALIRETFDKRIRNDEELTELAGVPVLTRIPVRGRAAARQQAYQEAFELLRTNLALSDANARVIGVTSALPGDGKTTVLRGLSEAFAASGETVIAVDCDLRRPMLGQIYGAEANEGLTNVLISARRAHEVLRPTEVPGVRVLPSGPQPPNPSSVVGLPTFGELLRDLRREADFVLVDTPPVAAGAETSTVAAGVDAVVLVVDLRSSRRDALAAAREQLARAGARVLGTVLNRSVRPGLGYSYYYSRDGGDVAPAKEQPAAERDEAAVLEREGSGSQ